MEINNIRNSLQDSKTNGITYGYIRVSTIAQHDDRQRIAMEEFGITADHIFADKQSGKNFDRPAYNELMTRLSPNDTLVVKSLDRLGRSYEEMIRQLDIITHEKGAFIVVLDLPILDSRNKYGDDLTAKLVLNLVIQIFSYVAQMEREMNHRRTMEGIAAAKAKGVRFGRKPMERPNDFDVVYSRWASDEISAREAARLLSVATSTFLRWVKINRCSTSHGLSNTSESLNCIQTIL